MKSLKKIVHIVEFGNYKQEWELSFDYDNESIDNVQVVANNYKDGKFILCNNIEMVLSKQFIDAMIASIDILAEEQDARDNSDFLGIAGLLDDITIRPTNF